MLFGEEHWFVLEDFLLHLKRPEAGLYKCRVTYDDRSKDVQFIPYEAKVIRSLRLVQGNGIEYEHKYTDRKGIDDLFTLRRDCDDILIVNEDRVTDSSYSNIVFKRKNNWYTPWSVLLKGTMRQNLLEWNNIIEEDIFVDDIKNFESFKLINAMLGFAGPEIDVSNIVY
jgi:4-amino-4-deoxychorismate lyase